MNKPLRILMIDDNPDDRALVKRELKREFEDVEFIEVIESEGFLKTLEEGRFDLVITDYRIRWTTGLNVLDKVRALYPDCPVIMFTGTGNEEVVVQAMKGGLDDYVVKTTSHFVRLPASVRTVLKYYEEKEALKRAEELYERLFENIPVGLYAVTTEGKIVAANKAMVEMLRCPDKKTLMEGDVWKTYEETEDRERWLERLKKEKVVTNFERKLKTHDGEVIWVKNTARAITDEEGNMVLIEGSMEDITDKKKAEMALSMTKERLEKLHDVANVLEKCSNDEEILKNTMDATKEILGFSSSSILFHEEGNMVVKFSTNEKLKPGTKKSMDTGICGLTFKEKKSFLIDNLKDWPEATPAEEEYRSAISVPMGDMGVFQVISNQIGYFDENDLLLVEILVSHTSEALKRIRYQNELKEKEELYRTIFENSGTAIAIINEDMTAAMINQQLEKFTGYDREDLVGDMKWTRFVLEEHIDEMKKLHILRRETPDSVPVNYTFKFINRYGDTRDMLVNVSMIPGTKQSLISLIDITQNLKTLRAFEESQEMFRLCFEKTDQGMTILDLDGKILEVNKAFCDFTGYEERELVGISLEELLNEDKKSECMEELALLAKGDKKAFEGETILMDKKGNQVNSKINVSAVTDYTERVRQLLAFVNKKEMEDI